MLITAVMSILEDFGSLVSARTVTVKKAALATPFRYFFQVQLLKLTLGKSTPSYIKRCQRYISSLKYNMIGFQLYYIDKGAPLLALHKTAKEMIKCALPIKCLEAVILSQV